MENGGFKLAIPTTGRLAQEALEWLASLGVLETLWVTSVVETINDFKKLPEEKTARDAVKRIWEEGLEGVTLKYDLRSGWRAAFSAKDAEMGGNPVTVYGSESPSINGILQGLGDVTVIGYDELVAAMVRYLYPGMNVPEWDKLNSRIVPKSTDVHVIGSTRIRDYAGLFLMVGESVDVNADYLLGIRSGRTPVYVKGQNEGLLYYLLGNDVDGRATEHVEQAARDDKTFCFDLVRSGSTVERERLKLVGNPLLVTMSVIAVDLAKHSANPDLQQVVNNLNPGEASEDYGEGIPRWETGLREKLGHSWLKVV